MPISIGQCLLELCQSFPPDEIQTRLIDSANMPAKTAEIGDNPTVGGQTPQVEIEGCGASFLNLALAGDPSRYSSEHQCISRFAVCQEETMTERYGLQFADTEDMTSLTPEADRVGVSRNRSDWVEERERQVDPEMTCIRLDLEDLKCFEVVDRQFIDRGVHFTNAIALQPSNPAFPPHSGTIVLMGGPRNGWMEATFEQPACYVSCFVTSSRQTLLSAYDSDDQLLAQVEIPESNLAGSSSAIAPNTQLSIKIPNIHRVTFYAFDGQFSLDDFRFCFAEQSA